MSWNDIMRRVLPPVWDQRRKTYVHPHVTSPYGETYTRPKGSSNPHDGIDFNYLGGQTSLNLSHQGLRSPVTGVVTNAGEGNVGRIAIRDANGFTHEILHTHAQHVSIGDPVVAGQLIGTMGNTGVKPKLSGHPGDQHVHYQLKDRDGKVVDPTTYWDQQGPIDPDPAPPAYLDDYQRYLATPGAAMGNADINALNDGVVEKSSLHQFQSPPTKAAVPYLDQTNAARQHFAQAASPPLAPSNPSGPDQQGSLSNPFGNAVPSQAPASKLPSDFPELSSPDLPLGWSRMTPEELIQALPQHEPEPLPGEAAHEWFANWIKSFR